MLWLFVLAVDFGFICIGYMCLRLGLVCGAAMVICWFDVAWLGLVSVGFWIACVGVFCCRFVVLLVVCWLFCLLFAVF